MKSLTIQTAALLAAPQQEMFYLAEIDWGGAALRRYAQRTVVLDGAVFEPRLAGIIEFSTALDLDPLRPGGQRDRLALRLVDTAGAASEPIAALLDRFGPAGHPVRLYAVPGGRDAVPTLSDRVLLQAFVSTAAERRPGEVRLEAEGLRSALTRRPLCRTVSPALFAGATSDAVGRPIPVLFGSLRRVPLTPWRLGRPAVLAADVSPADTVIPLVSLEGLPPSGSVQIGSEVLAYTELDAAARTLGTSATPVSRQAPAAHEAGSPVYSVPSGGFAFLLADHPCRAVGPVYAEQVPLDPQTFSIATVEAGGRTATAVFFPRLPVQNAWSPAPTELRLDNRRWPGALVVAPDSNALYEPLAIDQDGEESGARLTWLFPTLAVNVLADLGDGWSRFGALRDVTLHLDYLMTGDWRNGSRAVLSASRPGASLEIPLPAPPDGAARIALPAHTHSHNVAALLPPTQPLVTGAPVVVTVGFDSVEGERTWADGSQSWPGAARAIDGRLDEPVPSFSGAGRALDFTPLRLRRMRAFFGPGQRLERLVFKTRVASAGDGGPRQVRLAAFVEGGFLGQRQSSAGSAPLVLDLEIPAERLTAAALASPQTYFEVSEVNGALLHVFEAWLEAHLSPGLQEGAASALAASTQGLVGPNSDAWFNIPYRGRVDVSLAALLPARADGDFAETGWTLFSPPTPPRIAVTLQTPVEDETFLYVLNVALSVAYAPRTGERIVAGRLFADVDGVTDAAAGELVDNPADILRWLICDAAALALPAGAVDQAAFASAREALETRGYRFAAMVRGAESIEALLERVAWEASLALYFTGERFTLRVLERWMGGPAGLPVLDENGILPEGRVLEESGAPAPAALLVEFGLTPESENRSAAGALLIGSENQAGGARRVRLAWHRADGEAAVRDWGSVVLARAGDPQRRLMLQAPVSGWRFDPLDTLALSEPRLGLSAAPGLLGALRLVSPARVALECRLAPVGEICWQADGGNAFLMRLPGRFELFAVIAGRAVALLDASGRLFLRGQVHEDALTAAAAPAPLSWAADAQHLVFAAGEAAPYIAAFALDAGGNLLVRGRVIEHARPPVPLPSFTGCLTAGAGGLYLSPDHAAPALWFDAATLTLALRASLSEHHPL
ncbi:MAG: hypothetical protein Kow0059_15750 [Candidatus Sumerlaeia bacterium]